MCRNLTCGPCEAMVQPPKGVDIHRFQNHCSSTSECRHNGNYISFLFYNCIYFLFPSLFVCLSIYLCVGVCVYEMSVTTLVQRSKHNLKDLFSPSDVISEIELQPSGLPFTTEPPCRHDNQISTEVYSQHSKHICISWLVGNKWVKEPFCLGKRKHPKPSEYAGK